MADNAPIVFTVIGAPRTKKTSSNVVDMGARCPACRRGKVSIVLPSDDHREWHRAAVPQLVAQWAGRKPLGERVNVAAVFYREKAIGDLIGYMQALADALEAPKPPRAGVKKPRPGGAAVLVNDRQIVSWDGSRLAKDAHHPRIEVTLTILPDEQPDLFAAADLEPHPLEIEPPF